MTALASAGRGPRGWLAVAACAVAVGAPSAARADVLPPSSRPIDYSYELENLEAFSDRVFVMWPRSCGSSGQPLGTIDLALNPQWEPRMHDIDYEVVSSAKRLDVPRYCAETMRLYALPAARFATASQVVMEDRWTLGVKKGDTITHVPALDAIDLKARMAFLAEDESVARSSRGLDVVLLVRTTVSSLKAVHDVLRVERVEGAAVDLVPKRARYTYMDGVTEEVPYTSGTRPSPSRPGALARPGTSFFGEDDAASPGPTPSTASSQTSAGGEPDSVAVVRAGSRRRNLWWALAALALVVVGAVAWRRRASNRAD